MYFPHIHVFCICRFVLLIFFVYLFFVMLWTNLNLHDSDDRSCLNYVTVKKEELQCFLSYLLKPTKGDNTLLSFIFAVAVENTQCKHFQANFLIHSLNFNRETWVWCFGWIQNQQKTSSLHAFIHKVSGISSTVSAGLEQKQTHFGNIFHAPKWGL